MYPANTMYVKETWSIINQVKSIEGMDVKYYCMNRLQKLNSA